MLRSNFLALALLAAGLSFPVAWRRDAVLPAAARWTAVFAAGALTTTIVGSALLVLGAIA